MKIGVDIRVLMDKNYSGISEYTANLLSEIIRQNEKAESPDEYRLFYNYLHDLKSKFNLWQSKNSVIIRTCWPNKIFNYLLEKAFSYPKLDKVLGGVDIFWSPHFNFTVANRSSATERSPRGGKANRVNTTRANATPRSTTRFQTSYGPYAVVAGGSYGLGAAFAEGIARRGVNLVLLARDEERLTATATRLRESYDIDVIAVTADMADWDSVKEQLGELTASIGLLVYDAAYAPIGRFEDATDEQLAQAAAVNVRAPLLLTKLLSAPMIERGRGGILLMSSLAGSQGSPNIAAYAATKAFNTILAEGLWCELKPRGVDVLACCAGAILTPGYQQAESAKTAPGTLAADDVAEQALNALGKGPIVVPGAVNKLGRFVLTRLLSRRAAIAIMSKNTGGLS